MATKHSNGGGRLLRPTFARRLLTLLACLALVAACTAATVVAAVEEEERESAERGGPGSVVAAFDQFPLGYEITSVPVDELDDRSHRRHHVHRTLQADQCTGYPKPFAKTLYIVMTDVFGVLDTVQETALFEGIVQRVLTNDCSNDCVVVEEVDVGKQFYDDLEEPGVKYLDAGVPGVGAQQKEVGRRQRRTDEEGGGGGGGRELQAKKKRAKRTRKRLKAIACVRARGQCYNCGEGEVLPEDSTGRVRLLRATEGYGGRRLGQCAERLRAGLKASKIDAFECIRILELTHTDPRCYL